MRYIPLASKNRRLWWRWAQALKGPGTQLPTVLFSCSTSRSGGRMVPAKEQAIGGTETRTSRVGQHTRSRGCVPPER